MISGKYLDLVNSLLAFHEWGVDEDTSYETMEEIAEAMEVERQLDKGESLALLRDLREAYRFRHKPKDARTAPRDVSMEEILQRAENLDWAVFVEGEDGARYRGAAGETLAFFDWFVRNGSVGCPQVRLTNPEGATMSVVTWPNPQMIGSEFVSGLAEAHDLRQMHAPDDEEIVEIDWEFLARDLAANLRNMQEETIDWVRDMEGERPSLDERYGRATKALRNYDRAIAGEASRAASEFLADGR